MPLESEIMAKIGLPMHYNYYNGSGSCRHIRQRAAQNLESVIQKQHDSEPTSIAPPDPELIRLLKKVAERGDSNQYMLTGTWIAASYIIAEHIHQATADEKARQEAYAHTANHIRQNYLSNKGW